MTLQNKIWANRIQNLPEINEDHMIGKIVTVGEKTGTVTKEAGDDATGEVYEVELEDGTTITAGAHEMTITDPDATEGEVSDDIQAEGTGSGDGCAEATEEEEVEEGKDEEYEKFFKAALKKFGVDSPAELEGDKKKEFFDYVDKNWKGESQDR